MSTLVAGEPTLPAHLTRFVGRVGELAELGLLLETHRLVTITGAGGSGKTRLAVQAARQSSEEVVWIDLAPVSDPALVEGEIAGALGVRIEGKDRAMAALSAALRERRVLMILDNCEHVVEAVSPLAESLLGACPGLRILATSREALGVAGEVAWLLPTLSLPAEEGSLAEVVLSEAVELFVARARDSLPSFRLDDANAPAVARICRSLDGLPLAIELAAARIRVLSPSQIADRLGDRFRLLTSSSRTAVPRHRTLRAAIDWSYDLLSDSEQLLLQRLSVFAGGFTLEAVEEVCTDERVEGWEVLDLLASLVDRSLVTMRETDGSARYMLLDTIHHYAADKAGEAGDAGDVRRRHARFFLQFAVDAAPHLQLGGSEEWMEHVDREIANLQAAAEWLLSQPSDSDDALRLMIALQWYFGQHNLEQGRRLLLRALEAPPGSLLIRGRALEAAGAGAQWLGDIREMLDRIRQALPIYREHGEPSDLARALSYEAFAHMELGDQDRVDAPLQEALELARATRGAPLCLAAAIAAHCATARGDVEAARTLLQEGQEEARRLGFTQHLKLTAIAMARVLRETGDMAGAAEQYRENLTRSDPRAQGWEAALALEGLAAVAASDGDYIRAARLLGAADAFRQRIGTSFRPYSETDRALAEELLQKLGDDAFRAAYAEGRALRTAQAVALALDRGARFAGKAGEVVVERLPDGGRGILPPGLERDVELAPGTEDLRVRALGSLEVWVNGEAVEAQAWSHARPRQLLLYLLLHPEGRTRSQIALEFWPEASAAQSKNSFHVLLHKLRKSLGRSDIVVVESERYRIDPELNVWFDADVFKRELTEALRLSRAVDERGRTIERALDLYRGDLLHEGNAGDWLPDAADRLRRLYADGLGALAEIREEEQELEAAAEILTRLVRVDTLREEAYRRLMNVLARTGRRNEALRQYARLTALLQNELDAEPDPETRQLADRLRAASQD